MRRLGLLAPLLAGVLLVTGCQVKVPSAALRQAPNPCRALGEHRLARLAGARGTVSQKQSVVFSQAQACEFKAAAGTPVLIMGIVDGHRLSFDQEVVKAGQRYHATGVRQVSVRGTDAASAMLATFNGARVPVLMATHDGFIYLMLAVTQPVSRGRRIERATMTALVHATR